jgi:hypothetical protein
MIVKSYDYSSLITDSDEEDACHIVKGIIDSGNYFTNSPPYQTKENLFARPEAVWLKYRMTFLTSVFLYLGKEHRVANMQAWSFMTNRQSQPDRNKLWHHHDKHGMKGLSGILYLHVPDIHAESGTELAPNGPEGAGKFYIGPNKHTWNIYPSETWHRPGINSSEDYRYIIAVDVGYYE